MPYDKEGTMYALVLVLNKVDELEDVLAAMMKAGVQGATILDSQGMGSAIVIGDNQNLPLFGSLKSMFDREHPYNKTVFTIIETEELLNNTITAIQDTVGNLDKPNEGLMFTVPVMNVYGMKKDAS